MSPNPSQNACRSIIQKHSNKSDLISMSHWDYTSRNWDRFFFQILSKSLNLSSSLSFKMVTQNAWLDWDCLTRYLMRCLVEMTSTGVIVHSNTVNQSSLNQQWSEKSKNISFGKSRNLEMPESLRICGPATPRTVPKLGLHWEGFLGSTEHHWCLLHNWGLLATP